MFVAQDFSARETQVMVNLDMIPVLGSQYGHEGSRVDEENKIIPLRLLDPDSSHAVIQVSNIKKYLIRPL